MPRYYFDVDTGDRYVRDEEGDDLPDVAAAREAAVGLLPALARNMMFDRDRREIVSTVRDDRGQALLRATLMLAVVWPPPSPSD